MTYGGVRWKTVTCWARFRSSGTNCTALAPVPMTATRLPVRSTSWSHRAEWKASPAKLSRFGMSGSAGRDSCPTAGTKTVASKVSPPRVSTRQRPRASSNAAPVTSVRYRMCGSSPYFAMTRRR